MSYIAKAEVYFKIDSDYADGIGEAQREVMQVIDSLSNSHDEVKIAQAIRVEILDGDLIQKDGESHSQLIHKIKGGGLAVLDDGIF